MNVDVRAAIVQELDALAVHERRHGHRRVVRIELFDQRRNVIDSLPDHGVIAIAEAFRLVTHSPHQQRRMVLVLQHHLARPFELRCHLGRVAVVEAMTLMAEPDSDGHGHPERVSVVHQRADVATPGPDRVGAGSRELVERPVAARTVDEVRLAAAQ